MPRSMRCDAICHMPSLALLGGLLLALGCDDGARQPTPDPAPPPIGEVQPCAYVAVHSDYTATAVSLLDDDGRVCRDAALRSGMVAPGVLADLSGDVIAARGQHPDGWVTLIDRTSAILTLYDPAADAVVEQLDVGTGFTANPQDVLYLARDRALVSRYASNPEPGRMPHDAGDDVLLVDPTTGAILGRVDLTAHADPERLPRAARLLWFGERPWVVLAHLSRDFMQAGPGRVLRLTADGRAVDAVVELPYENCISASLSPAGGGLWLSCAGVFARGVEGQIERAGVAFVDLVADPPVVAWHAPAGALFGRPPFVIAALDDQQAAVVLASHPTAQQPDAVHLVDRRSEATEALPVESEPFQITALAYVPAQRLLLVPDGDPQAPVLRRLRAVDGGGFEALPPVDTNPSIGLPLRELVSR